MEHIQIASCYVSNKSELEIIQSIAIGDESSSVLSRDDAQIVFSWKDVMYFHTGYAESNGETVQVMIIFIGRNGHITELPPTLLEFDYCLKMFKKYSGK